MEWLPVLVAVTCALAVRLWLKAAAGGRPREAPTVHRHPAYGRATAAVDDQPVTFAWFGEPTADEREHAQQLAEQLAADERERAKQVAAFIDRQLARHYRAWKDPD